MKQIKVISFLLALFAVNNIFKFTPATPQFVYYGMMVMVVFASVTKGPNKTNFTMVWLIIACIASIIFNTIPSFFKVEQRFVIFFIAMLCISPLLSGDYINMIKSRTFHYTNLLLLALTFLSFFGQLTGAYPVAGPGGVSGVTVHSMTLGVVGGLSLLYVLYVLSNGPITKKIKYRYGAMAFISVFVLILAGSRGALLGAIFGVLIFVFRMNKGKFSKSLKVLFIMSIALVLTSPIWMEYTDTLVEKSNRIDSDGNLSSTSSRDEIWEYRKEEFYQSPVVGIGFASAKYGLINDSTGQIEPGSNWGAIAAQIGLLGAIPFLLLILNYFNFLWKSQNSNIDNAFLIGLLGFFTMHWFVEGYMLSAGAFEFFYAWLLLGVIQSEKSNL